MPETDETKLAVMANNIEYIKRDVNDIKGTISQSYVSKDEFDPVKKIVYGLVALILVSVVGALLALVINRGGL